MRLRIEEDANGDMVIILPEELLEDMGLDIGDPCKVVQRGDKIILDFAI